MEEVFYEKLELRKENRPNNLEQLAQAMNEAGKEFGAGTPYGKNFIKTQEKGFINSETNDFIYARKLSVCFQYFLNS